MMSPESRELAKEMQRQEKAKLLAGGSQTLIRWVMKRTSTRKSESIPVNDYSEKFPRSRHVINEWGPNSLQITKPRLIEQACKYFVVVWLILEREKVKIS